MRFDMSRVGPFMRHLSLHRGEIATDGAIRLMARGGVPAVTLRSLATDFRITPQAVRQWFGGTEEMWEQIVQRFGWRWVASLTDPRRDDPWRNGPGRTPGELIGLHHLLPLGAEDLAATRAWLATTQLGRDDEARAASVSAYEESEVEVVASLADVSHLALGPLQLDLLVAAVRGLRHAACATHRPMSLARAHAVLDVLIDGLRESAAARAATGPSPEVHLTK